MSHEKFMQLALDQAVKGCGWVNPNPMVGAVIVKDGEVVGKGFHQRYGGLHAERNAIADASSNIEGSTMYVTLEPCCHYGKTPPCTDAIIESGITTVVVGAEDPNVKVAGKGIQILKDHGIDVILGVLEEKCLDLNEVFFHFITVGSPFVAMKYAMTLDGKISSRTGKSKWITDEAAREHTHTLRHRYSSIMVGIGTVLADDPLLTCRVSGCRNPVRIICDSTLKIPEESKIVQTSQEVETYVATVTPESEKSMRLRERGVNIIQTRNKDGRVDLQQLMGILGGKKIDSILLEGGSELHASALQSGIVNKAYVYIAPKIFGGILAKSPVGGDGIDDPADAFILKNGTCNWIGNDLLLEYILKRG